MRPRQKVERQEVYIAVLLHTRADKNTKTKKEITYFTEKKRRNSNCCAPQATVWISDSVKKKGESEENEYWQELSQQPVQNGKGERAAFCRALLLNLVLRDNDREARASTMNG